MWAAAEKGRFQGWKDVAKANDMRRIMKDVGILLVVGVLFYIYEAENYNVNKKNDDAPRIPPIQSLVSAATQTDVADLHEQIVQRPPSEIDSISHHDVTVQTEILYHNEYPQHPPSSTLSPVTSLPTLLPPERNIRRRPNLSLSDSVKSIINTSPSDPPTIYNSFNRVPVPRSPPSHSWTNYYSSNVLSPRSTPPATPTSNRSSASSSSVVTPPETPTRRRPPVRTFALPPVTPASPLPEPSKSEPLFTTTKSQVGQKIKQLTQKLEASASTPIKKAQRPPLKVRHYKFGETVQNWANLEEETLSNSEAMTPIPDSPVQSDNDS